MHIVIDARWIFPQLSGIGVVTRELIRALVQLEQLAPTGDRYTLLFEDPALAERTRDECGFGALRCFQTERVPYGIFSPRGQILLPMLLHRIGAEVYHSTNYMMPLPLSPRRKTGKVAAVVTVHDLIPMVFRDHAPKSRKSRFYPLYHRLMLEIGSRADAILTVSEASRGDVLERLRIKKAQTDKVVAVPNGVGERFVPGLTGREQPPVILYVGRFDPYKNVPLLIEAFARARSDNGLPEGTRLRIVGAPDPRYPEARERAEALHLGEAVDWRDYVDGDELLRFYQEAAVLVMPSDYEGFGLPALEAMACATPVIATRASSLPEVLGDTGILTPPRDTETLAAALQKVLADPEAARKLGEAGCARAQTFTWQRSAQMTREVYARFRRD